MTLDSSVDIFYIVAAVALAWVAVFLCWMLYEIARFFHQTNIVVEETREKIGRFEQAILSIKERLESSVSYLGVLAEGGKSLMSYFHNREEKKEKKRKKGKLLEDEDEE
ncbi:MAG: hypothetical protein ABIB04_03465 [Patescibacteria group bacterium]